MTRSFTNAFEIQDYTPELKLVPNQWNLIDSLGIFNTEGVVQHSITLEKNDQTIGLLTDRMRGDRNNVSKDGDRSLFSYAIPHFPLDDFLSVRDLKGKRAYGSPDQPEVMDTAIARKLERLAASHNQLLEASRAYAIVNGAIYATNGTVVGNYYTDFGITRKDVDFVLGTTTTELTLKGEEGIAHIQDNVQTGSTPSEYVALCHPTFFDRLVTHAVFKDAYRYFSSTQNPLRDRLGAGRFREFSFGGITYISYRGVYPGTTTPLLTDGEARLFPRGVADMFMTYNSPADKFNLIDTLGEPMYSFMYRDPTDDKIVMQTESNVLNVVRRPQAVVRLFSSN
jgi:hypothetical protein